MTAALRCRRTIVCTLDDGHDGACEPEPAATVHATAQIGGKPQWRGRQARFPVQIDPTATIGPLTQVDAGCERPTTIGAGTDVQGMVHIGHGVQVGKGCDIASGTVIAGEVTVGDYVRIGVGACITPFVEVGDCARIGAGAVVVKDVPPEAVVAGNPARVFRRLNDAEVRWVEERFAECE